MILVIEDDEDTRLCYQEFLGLHSLEVRLAASGAEALAAVRERAFDAVLLDLSLPDADGRTLCGALHAASCAPLPRVLAITGYDLRPDERAAFAAVMRKPVNLDAVLAWLRKGD